MKTPLLTVCLITFNQEKYVRQAVDSILSQETDFSWKLIIADDQSTDGTQDILQAYKKAHADRIQLIIQEKNVGPETNWLDLLAAAKSEYVLYAEGDDYFTSTSKLQEQVEFLQAHEDYAMCFHPVTITYEDGSRPDETFPTNDQLKNKKTFALKDLLAGNFMQANSVMYRWRFAHEDINDVFPRGIVPGDWFLHILHAEKGKIGFLDKSMSTYRRHNGGIWWSTLSDPDAFWEKYGLQQINFHAEMLRRFGSNAVNRAIISKAILEICTQPIEVDAKRHTSIIRDAITRYPELVNVLVTAQHEALIRGSQQLEDSRRSVERLTDEFNISKSRYDAEVNNILQSPSFRTGYIFLHPWKIPSELRRQAKKAKKAKKLN